MPARLKGDPTSVRTVADAVRDGTWRCRLCKRSQSEGADPSVHHGLYRNICRECLNGKARARRRGRVAAQSRKPAQSYGVGYKFTKAELAAKYRAHAVNCERHAANVERYDPDMAARLRDQARDWRALARNPYGA